MVEDLMQYIKTENAVLVSVLFCLGKGLKNIRQFPNQCIPLTLTVLGILLALLSAAAQYEQYANFAAALLDGVVQGVLCAGMSVYLHEVVKHCKTCDNCGEENEEK